MVADGQIKLDTPIGKGFRQVQPGFKISLTASPDRIAGENDHFRLRLQGQDYLINFAEYFGIDEVILAIAAAVPVNHEAQGLGLAAQEQDSGRDKGGPHHKSRTSSSGCHNFSSLNETMPHTLDQVFDQPRWSTSNST
jgi:hypothetical protein